jgi:hypothetical protein
MRTVIRGALIVLSAAVLSAAAPSPAAGVDRTARGTGSLRFGPDGDGVGYFELTISGDPMTTGSLLFAGEHHDAFPDIVVRVTKIDRARFGAGWVRFSAHGTLLNDPVRVTGTAWDGAAAGRADRLSLQCVSGSGQVVMEAEGDLIRGDIVIGTPQ